MKTDTIIAISFMAILLFVGVSLIINSSKSCDVSIDYDVSVKPVNLTMSYLPEIKLACYKLCIEELKGYNLLEECLNKCEVLT